MKTIGVLTSGGDAPGMNACIRAVVRTACEKGMNVYGINRGYNGLMEDDMFEMDLRSVSDIINRGGTVLCSARSLNFKTEEGMQAAIDVCNRRGIEGIVVIGGDGSFRGERDLSLFPASVFRAQLITILLAQIIQSVLTLVLTQLWTLLTESVTHQNHTTDAQLLKLWAEAQVILHLKAVLQ